MFKRLAQGISRTRDNLLGGLKSVLGKKRVIDEETLEALESALLVADCGSRRRNGSWTVVVPARPNRTSI